MKNILPLAFLIFIFSDLNSQNRNVLSIKTKQERIDIENEYIKVYMDSTDSLTIEEINLNLNRCK